MYKKRIDLARAVVAILFVASGFGFAACAHFWFQPGAVIFGVGLLTCLVATFGLCVEYLVRSWIETRQDRKAVRQITLAEILMLTAVVAVILALFRVLGAATIALLFAAVIILASAIESIRQGRAKGK